MVSVRRSLSGKEPFGCEIMTNYVRPIPEQLVVSREAQHLKTRLSAAMPPTPITPGFDEKEHNSPKRVQETIEECCEHSSGDKGCIIRQDGVPRCHQTRRVRRRLILHSRSAESDKAVRRSKLSSPASVHGKPTLHDLADAAEYYRINKPGKHSKIGKASNKRVRIILKKTVIPRTLNDQIAHTLIKSYQAVARADDLVATRSKTTFDDESS